MQNMLSTIMGLFGSQTKCTQETNAEVQQNSNTKKISAIELLKHNHEDDLWTVIDNKVYDLTKYHKNHPGNVQIIIDYAGKDSTEAFNQANHSSQGLEEMKQFYIGDYQEANEQEKAFIELLERKNKEIQSIKNGSTFDISNNDIEDVEVKGMFCYQCGILTKDNGPCTVVGKCGKQPSTSALHDLLIYYVKGVCQYASRLDIKEVPFLIKEFVVKCAFATLTNVNFNDAYFFNSFKQSNTNRNLLKEMYEKKNQDVDLNLIDSPAAFIYKQKKSYLFAQAKQIGVLEKMHKYNADIVGLLEMLNAALKGLCVYFYHAECIRQEFPQVYNENESNYVYQEIIKLYTIIAEEQYFTMEKLVEQCLHAGEVCMTVLRVLDQANGVFGDPEPTEVNCTPVEGKCILISGHDILILYHLLKQTQGTGINVYTHSELLPSHSYPLLKQFPHLKGNYGGAYHQQQLDFTYFPGAILLTANCLLPPQKAYKQRLFTSSLVDWPGIQHIDGYDFSSLIACSLENDGFTAQILKNLPEKYKMPKEVVGFGHKTILSIADKVIDAIKAGHVKRIFVIGGCDQAGEQNDYSRKVALAAQKESLILTLGCLKYRLRDLNIGTTGGLPRLLDIGQCNDSYSAIVIASALAKALNTDIHSLPLNLVISWMEQDAVIILLGLLHLGFKNIRLGPILPKFLTPNLIAFLVEKFNLKVHSGNAEKDVYDMEHNIN